MPVASNTSATCLSAVSVGTSVRTSAPMRAISSQNMNRASKRFSVIMAVPSATDSAATHTWTTEQIVTATVHQAWLLSGKDEGNFFEIVKELAELSAKNRNLVLPDSPEAGQKAGAYIKKHAKADHDQLLYAIVDKSVRMTGTKAPASN